MQKMQTLKNYAHPHHCILSDALYSYSNFCVVLNLFLDFVI